MRFFYRNINEYMLLGMVLSIKHSILRDMGGDDRCLFPVLSLIAPSDVYINCLKKNDILISMDGKGRATDNVFIERLWRSVKYENIYLNAYETGQELYQGLDKYFRFYNKRRHHQSLQYRTPEEVCKGIYVPLKAA